MQKIGGECGKCDFSSFAAEVLARESLMRALVNAGRKSRGGEKRREHERRDEHEHDEDSDEEEEEDRGQRRQ